MSRTVRPEARGRANATTCSVDAQRRPRCGGAPVNRLGRCCGVRPMDRAVLKAVP
jgi:hypothetical protein